MPTCHVPLTVRLAGDPAAVPDEDLAAAVERTVTNRLDFVRRELLARGVSGRGATVLVGVAASTPSERVDAERLVGFDYELPSFDTGERASLPVRSRDPNVEAQRALARIHRQLETGIFDWWVTRDEAREVLRVLRSLHGEALFRTVQAMWLTGAWRTFGRALGDADSDALIELQQRLDRNMGELMPGDSIQVTVFDRAGSDERLSGTFWLTRDGLTHALLPHAVPVIGSTPEQAADAIARALVDALISNQPIVDVAVTERGSLYAPRHGRVNPVAFRSRIRFASTQTEQARRFAAFVDYVRIVDARDPLAGLALGHYWGWIERNRGAREFLTREPHDLWSWALRQASARPPESPLERFLDFLRRMTDAITKAPPETRREMEAARARYVAWLDRHSADPDLASRDPATIWSQAWVGVIREEIAEQQARRRREAAERREAIDLVAVNRKLDEAFELVNRRILPMREPEAIDAPSQGFGYLIFPSEAEHRIRVAIAHQYLTSVLQRVADPAFVHTTARADFDSWLAEHPDQRLALELAVEHPYVEHYAIEVDTPAWQTVVEVGIGFIPIVGQIVAVGEIATGYSITGRRLSTLEQGILAAGILLPAAARVGRIGYAATATARIAPAYRMSAAEAEVFFRATARIAPGTAGNSLLTRAVERVQAGRALEQGEVRQLETLMRDMGMSDPATARVLETRAASQGPLAEATDDEIAALLREEGWTRPRVTGGQRPRIADVPVPARRAVRMDIQDIARAVGESQTEALGRVERLIYRRIDQTPLAEAWEAARARVLGGRSIASVTRDEMLGSGGRAGLYDRVRDEFWREVRRRPDATQWLDEAGFDLREGLAPRLRVNRTGIPAEETRVSLDHLAEKAQGENWRRAIDADNLQFEFQSPNSYREIVQARFRMRSGTPAAALPGSGSPAPQQPDRPQPPGGTP